MAYLFHTFCFGSQYLTKYSSCINSVNDNCNYMLFWFYAYVFKWSYCMNSCGTVYGTVMTWLLSFCSCFEIFRQGICNYLTFVKGIVSLMSNYYIGIVSLMSNYYIGKLSRLLVANKNKNLIKILIKMLIKILLKILIKFLIQIFIKFLIKRLTKISHFFKNLALKNSKINFNNFF